MIPIFRRLSNLWISADKFDACIRNNICKEFKAQDDSVKELLSLTRGDAGSCDVTSVLANVIPHQALLFLHNQPYSEIWGFLKRAQEVRSYVSLPKGRMITFDGSGNASQFVNFKGEKIIWGSGIFGKSIEWQSASSQYIVTPLNWRPDWNSGWQKEPIIRVSRNGKAFLDLILQPFRDDPALVKNHSPEVFDLPPEELMCFLSYSIIGNSRFVG